MHLKIVYPNCLRGEWDEWVLLFSTITSPWRLARGACSSKDLAIRLQSVAVTPLPQALPRQSSSFNLCLHLCLGCPGGSLLPPNFVFIISTGSSPLRTCLSVFSLITIVPGRIRNKKWGIHVALNRLSFSAFQREKTPKTKNQFSTFKSFKLQRWSYPRWKWFVYCGTITARKKWKPGD